MKLTSRLVLVLLFLVMGWATATQPVRAQAPPSGRFAFADTTLLRDTLDLHFVGLFVLAESLRVTPDSLRAWAIRYAIPIERIAHLADSLRMPADSVGAVMERERYNPLAQRAERLTSFGYNTTYSIGRQSTSWSNTSDYNLVRGPIVLRNVTVVRIDRIREAGGNSFHRGKTANTEAGYKLSPDLSIGARVNLLRNENFRPGSIYNRTTTTNEFQLSLRSQKEFTPQFAGGLNVFTGPFNEPNSNPIKSGFGTQFDGNMNYARGPSPNMGLNVDGTVGLGETHIIRRVEHRIRDFSVNTSGSVGMFENRPLSARINFGAREDRTARPDTITQFRLPDSTAERVDIVNRDPSGALTGDVALQYRHGANGVVTVTGRVADSRSQLSVARDGKFTTEQTRSKDLGMDANARFTAAGWTLEGQFSNAIPISDSPRRSVVETQNLGVVTVDYRERARTHNRNLLVNASRSLTPRIQFKAIGQVTLSSYRFEVTDDDYLARTGGEPVEISNPREDYRQSYRLEGSYLRPNGFTNTLGLDVQRVLSLYLDAAHSSTNREDRIYRIDWRWTYRLLPGLTATQRNQISATYVGNLYAPEKNRLSMSYLTITTLNASIGPRLSLDLTHSATYRPNGDYVRSPVDGLQYFNISDSNRDYSLVGHIGYTPISFVTLALDPYYTATSREGTIDGRPAPDNSRRSLNFTGGASVNLPVAGRGRLSGSLNRNTQASRYVKYVAGVPRPDPATNVDYWQGSLQFSWSL